MNNKISRVAAIAVMVASFGAAVTAMAADAVYVPPQVWVPPPPAPPPLYDWSGLTLGLHGGWATGPAESLPTGILTGIGDMTVEGPFVGGQIGFNFGSRLIIGVEADASWAGIDGSIVNPPIGPNVTVQEVDSMYTVRGKLGWAMGSNGQILPYITGGWGWANATRTVDTGGGQVATNTHSGWNAGIGVDVGVSENVTVGVLYLYHDLSAETYVFPVGNDPLIDINLHTLSFRVNILF